MIEAVPVEVSTLTTWASPSTHGIGDAQVVRLKVIASHGPLSAVNVQNASSTWTCAMLTASGPSLIRLTTMAPGSRTTR